MDTKRFYDNYRAFLVSKNGCGYGAGYAEDFVSHLKRVSKLFFPLPDKSIDCFAALEDNPVVPSRIEFVQYMIARVQLEQQNPYPVTSVNNLRRYTRALEALEEYFHSLNPSLSIPSQKPASQRKQSSTLAKRIELSGAPSLPDSYLGFDPDCEHVYYDKKETVPNEKKVPGLAAYLEERYGRIIDFLCGALQPGLQEGVYPRRIPVILKQGHPADDYPLDVVEWVLKQWELYYHDLSASDIIRMLKKNGNKFPILGLYIPNPYNPVESHIEIYYENSTNAPIEEYFALFEGVLCHEYAHHIHHLYLDRRFLENDETAKIIQESIADFASFAYLGKYGSYEKELRFVALEKCQKWEEYFCSGWPYAEALWFLHDRGRFPCFCPPPVQSMDKLAEVFRESVDYPTALSILHH